MTRFARCAWSLLAYDVLVAAWGAYVRATGAGAGCGRHWPLCNGEIVPRAPRIETIVELSHRVTSGAALLLTLGLLAWSLRAYPRGHLVRRGAAWSAAFMMGEVLVGASLVVLRLVAHDQSSARAFVVAAHLTNTFFLLAATSLTAWWASGGAPVRVQGQRGVGAALGVPLAAMVVVGASGALTALGDTLFPAASLAAGLAQDLNPAAHLFVHLRVIHPVLAATTAAAIVVACGIVRALRPGRAVRAFSRAASALAVAQVGAGMLDILALAPVWMQLTHLVLADAVWIALVLTSAAALAEPAARPARFAPLSSPTPAAPARSPGPSRASPGPS